MNTATLQNPTALSDFRLGFSVVGEPIFLQDGTLVPKKQAIVRTDNRVTLGIFSEKYIAFQNEQMLELCQEIGNRSDLRIVGGDSFQGGRKVYLQMTTGNDLILGTDKVEGYITCLNSFDGSTPLSFGFSHKTMSCENMFYAGQVSATLKHRMRHTSNLDANVRTAVGKIERLRLQEVAIFNQIKSMNETAPTQQDVDMIFRRMLNLKEGSVLLSGDGVVVNERAFDSTYDNQKDEFVTEYSTRKYNQAVDLRSCIVSEMQQKGNSKWGLFSGVTRYSTHEQYSNLQESTTNKMFGGAGVTERKIFSDMVA